MSERIVRRIGTSIYELVIENSGADPEWPWFINAYECTGQAKAWNYPAWFCAGTSREDAIERVSRNLLEKQA